MQQWHGILLFRRANFDFLFHKPFFLSLKVACWVNVFVADSEEQRIKRQDVLIQISFSIFIILIMEDLVTCVLGNISRNMKVISSLTYF